MTEAPDNKRRDIWAAIGKFSLVVGVLIGLQTLLWPIISRKPALDVQAMYLTGNILPELIKSSMSPSVSTNLVKLFEYNAYLQYTLRNPGASEVSKIIIDTPYQGFVDLVPSNGKSAPTAQFTNVIQVGALRPRQSVIVCIWKTDLQDVLNTRAQVTISHDSGVASISEMLYVGGVSLFIVAYWIPIGFVLFLVTLFGGTWFFERLLRKRLISEKGTWRRDYEHEQTMRKLREETDSIVKKGEANQASEVTARKLAEPKR